MSTPTPTPNTPELIVATLRETIATLTERNADLERKVEEAVQAVADLIKKDPKCPMDEDRAKRLRHAYLNTQFNLAHQALEFIDLTLAAANQRPLDEVQSRVILKFLHSETMRGCCTVATTSAKGIDNSFLLGMDAETIEQWLVENASGDRVGEIAKQGPPNTFSKS